MEHKDPYLNARNEWLERYGNYISQARNWKLVAFGSILLAILAVTHSVVTYDKPRVEAFAVEYCSKSGEYNLTKLDPLSISDEMIKASLSNWIVGLREVSSDLFINQRNIKKSFAMIERSSPAEKQAIDDAKASNPQIRAKTELVEVKVESILRQSESTLQIDWLEIIRNAQSGEIIKTIKNRGNINYKLAKNIGVSELIENPTGMRIGEWRWTNVL